MEMSIDTVIGDNISVTVKFDYQPEERQTLNYPGCESSIDINSVVCVTTKSELIDVLSQSVLDCIEAECFKSISE